MNSKFFKVKKHIFVGQEMIQMNSIFKDLKTQIYTT